MKSPNERQVRAMRKLLRDAQVENSRMVAAAIGGHLTKITRQVTTPEIEGATETVRDASLALLTSLHRSHDVRSARTAALWSVAMLEATLPDPPSPRAATREPARRVSPLRRLAQRTLPALRPARTV